VRVPVGEDGIGPKGTDRINELGAVELPSAAPQSAHVATVAADRRSRRWEASGAKHGAPGLNLRYCLATGACAGISAKGSLDVGKIPGFHIRVSRFQNQR
jgi:hypothetical protein